MATTPVHQFVLLNGADSVSTGPAVEVDQFRNWVRNYVAIVEGTGAISATVLVEGSNNKAHWITLVAEDLSGTTSATEGGLLDESLQFIRGRVTAISGTGAAVTLTVGA